MSFNSHSNMMRRCALAALALPGVLAVCFASAAEVQAPLRHADAGPVFSPYLDVTLWPTPRLDRIATASGVKHFTLAFLVADTGGSKSLRWGGYPTYPVSKSSAAEAEWDFGFNLITGLNALRAAGGDVWVSFGGANGTPLEAQVTDLKALTAEYQRVIDTYHLTGIDFDVEGAWLADGPSIERRSALIQALQGGNPALKVWFTLPVLPTGLTEEGLKLLRSAVHAGVRVDGVNIMTMDYGDDAAPHPAGKMGDYAIAAATSVHAQLKTLLATEHLTEAQLWSRIGVTPMIGVNDLKSEVFDLQAARQLRSFADEKHLGRLSFWSISRDHPGHTAGTNDSGIAQEDHAFCKALMDKKQPL